ncbi:MAG: TfoX/Sxy family protein [Pseudomonadota bacterium]
MAISDEEIAFIQDLFADLGDITTRKMFGGLGLYSAGKIFAIKMGDGTVKLKGIGAMAETFEAEGWKAWRYTRKDGAASSMPYWDMPEALLDDPEDACAWARRAISHL